MLPVLICGGGEHCVTPARAVAWENSWHFARTPPTVSQRNDIWETSSGEIPYWWRVTSPIWVVLLIGWKFASTNHKHCVDLNDHQYGISPPLVSQTSFRCETVAGVAKCRQFSKATAQAAVTQCFPPRLVGTGSIASRLRPHRLWRRLVCRLHQYDWYNTIKA